MMECPDCGCRDLMESVAGFPVLGVPGPACLCRNCRLAFYTGERRYLEILEG